jgi:hypothetical protein
VFVQLPPVDLLNPGPALSKAIGDGMAYIFNEAKSLNRPVVVNLSLGGNHGPHDETWYWANHIDDLLTDPNRVVVVSAGNGFEQDTHAGAILFPGQSATLPWIVKPEDPRPTNVEIWYKRRRQTHCCADDTRRADVLRAQRLPDVEQAPQARERWQDHRSCRPREIGERQARADHASGPLRTRLRTRSTRRRPPGPGRSPCTTPAARTRGSTHGSNVDDVGKLGGRRQQSRFSPGVAYPGCTICDYAAGKSTIQRGGVQCRERSEVRPLFGVRANPRAPANPGRMKPDILRARGGRRSGRRRPFGVVAAGATTRYERHQRGGAPCRGGSWR